mgnify:CR=1 FL=1|jgi:hypothetical protein
MLTTPAGDRETPPAALRPKAFIYSFRKPQKIFGSLFVAAANPERSREAEPPETGLSISDDCWLIADKL